MKILCTGGAGYVGSACLRWLLDHGHEAYAYDDLSEGHEEAVPEDRLIRGNILDTEKLKSVMSDLGIEAVMHFAALASVPDSIQMPAEYYETNVVGTKSILDAMHAVGVKKVLLSSTAATYGFENPMPLVEDAVLAPQVPYGTTKLTAEQMIQDYAKAYGFGYVLLRYFNASGADVEGRYGEDRRKETHLIPLVLFAATGQRPQVFIYGSDWETRDGTCVRDFVHVDDLAEAHRLSVEAVQPGDGRIYNVGTGNGVTVLEVVKACEKVVGGPIPHEFTERRPGDPGVLVASPQRLMTDLGWQPKYADIESIVETAWKWHSLHPDGYSSVKSLS